jgi:predicted GH43/DUF377 family glycosyl hydrolase
MPPIKKPAAKSRVIGVKKTRRPARKLTVRRKTEKAKQQAVHELHRHDDNPIIQPNTQNEWENKATFNPAAILDDDKIHIIYRAIGDSDVSVLGYASSSDGFKIDERSAYPVFSWRSEQEKKSGPRETIPPIFYLSGGGWKGGCEDPRLTLIDNTVYMLYTAFDGWGSLRIALTSIKLDDLRNKRWNWKKPIMISPPGEMHKNWVIFPEKINGKFAILHSIHPKVLIDYFDNLDELGDDNYIKSQYGGKPRKGRWDSHPRGAGPPPIKTKRGWLLLYHAIDHRDPGRYKLGAMLLDLKDPTKVIARSKKPILEPDECYENEGFKPGIIYSCGAVVVNDQLLVYYGGADTVSCVAVANLDEFLKKLAADKEPKLSAKTVAKRSK